MNPIAQQLNETLIAENSAIYAALSKRGKSAFFPKLGIMGQSADAKGKRYNASIGIALEDDSTPMCLPVLAEQTTLPKAEVFPYASSYGVPALRDTWQQMIQAKNPSLVTPISKPVVTAALTHAISMASYLFLDDTDTLICADLYWGNYNLMVSATYGAQIKKYNTFNDNSFNLKAFEQALKEGSGKKVVILNCPNNPTGYAPTIAEAQQIITAIQKQAEAGDTIVAIIDDAYFGLVYEEGIYAESLFAPLANLHPNVLAIKVDGPTKEDYAWGYRVGFITFGCQGLSAAGYQVLEEKAAGAVRGTVSSVSHQAQSMLLRAYNAPEYASQKLEKFNTLQNRYRIVKDIMESGTYDKYFKALPFNSGYFMCVQLADGLTSEPIRQVLLKEYDTGLIGLGDKIRIAYSCLPAADIPVLFDNLAQACASASTHV